MKRMPSVKSCMTPFPYTIEASAPLAEAQAFMRHEQIRHLPVSRDGALVGLITDRDIKLLLGPEFEYPDASRITVGEAMLPTPYVVDLETPLVTVLDTLARRHIGSAIVTRKGKLAGVFTTTDAARAFAASLRERFGPQDGDAAA